MRRRVSNFPLAYQLSWLPRLLAPSLKGDRRGMLPPEATLASPPPERMLRLVFLGDISAVSNRQAPLVDESLRALLGSADLVVGNCESPVVERPRWPVGTAVGTRHSMTGAFLSETIAASGIRADRLLLSLANNHMLDQGVDGYGETRAALAALGIATIGGIEDGLVRTLRLGGVGVAFATFTQWRNAGPAAFAGRVAMLDDLARNDFSALRSAEADLVCVVAHWDREFRHFPQPETRRLAEALVACGAGLIVGHHAHVVQPAVMVGGTPVAYGIGDFLGTALPVAPWPLRIGVILSVDVGAEPGSLGRVVSYRFTPFFRERTGGRERLVPLDRAGAYAARAKSRFETLFPAGSVQAPVRPRTAG